MSKMMTVLSGVGIGIAITLIFGTIMVIIDELFFKWKG